MQQYQSQIFVNACLMCSDNCAARAIIQTLLHVAPLGKAKCLSVGAY